MKILILAISTLIFVSCGKETSKVSRSPENFKSVFVVSSVYGDTELYDFKKSADNYFSLSCGDIKDAEQNQNCINDSLKEAIAYNYDLCVITNDVKSELLEQAKKNCKILE